jgi:hypothetical protein
LDIWASSATNVFAVGAGGTVLHYPEAVAPLVFSVSPSAGRAGETLNVVISGGYLKGATGVAFGNGITVNSFNVDSPYRITANISIAAGTPVGALNVEVRTPGGVILWYSGFTVEEATPVPAEESGGRMWVQWVVLGVVCAAILGVAGYLLVRRRRKQGEKPAELKEKSQAQEPVRKPEPMRPLEAVRPAEPVRPEEPVLTAQPLPEEQPIIQEAASLASVSTLQARLASMGRDQGTGGAPPAKEEPHGETEERLQQPPAAEKPDVHRPGIVSGVTAKKEPRKPSGGHGPTPTKPGDQTAVNWPPKSAEPPKPTGDVQVNWPPKSAEPPKPPITFEQIARQRMEAGQGPGVPEEAATEESSDPKTIASKYSFAEAARLRMEARQRVAGPDKPKSPSDDES